MQIKRHKAAIRRHEYSLPVKCLVRDDFVNQERGLFDYGCGHGDDLAALQSQGVDCEGFDPTFRPESIKLPMPVVNLGFVLNVIEDVQERSATLKDAWQLAQQVRVLAG